MLICESPPYINLPVCRGEKQVTPRISKVFTKNMVQTDQSMTSGENDELLEVPVVEAQGSVEGEET